MPNAVKRHIDQLSDKDYANLAGLQSPDFVLMFMPVEPAYIEIMRTNRDLFNYGYKKNVILVSHTTLMPILRTVANLWMVERSNEEAREISDRAGDIFNAVCLGCRADGEMWVVRCRKPRNATMMRLKAWSDGRGFTAKSIVSKRCRHECQNHFQKT
jgi:hypothetical protein